MVQRDKSGKGPTERERFKPISLLAGRGKYRNDVDTTTWRAVK